ncbi:MAG: NYN domain-containing protein [Okeania sp. SIO2F4]|uniref:putative dsRNA-binding protein n=1 Tax=Okeania sp. SIO2F4 TaxID=2607790 RepID=UPI00142CFF1A|nr:putative dsRNA-binding protein [Okeania sp. SIO2F4]NES07965.1 NYN domain-containing protein [Okeania sp. SIO2F4]
MIQSLVSLYWDYQNVRINCNPYFARYCQNFAYLHGSLLNQRVYSYWRKESQSYEQRLYELGFDCIDIPKTEKQSVDKKLIADCEREISSTVSAEILILITGDEDYKNIVCKWKEQGKKVFIFANSKNANQKLLEALYLIAKFIKAIDAPEAQELAKEKQAVSRLLYQEQFRHEVRQNISPEKEKSIRDRLEIILEKIPFQDASLLQDALIHSTYLQENLNKAKEVNEYSDRLEFIGYKLLSFLSAEYLYHHYQNKSKDEIENLHLILGKDRQLAKFARDLNLGEYILLGKVEEAKQGYENNLLLSQIFTSVIGAYYIDSGVEAVRNFLEQMFTNALENPLDLQAENQEIKRENYNSKIENSNPKNYFQEWVQKKGKSTDVPRYKTDKCGGSDHQPIFLSEVFVADIKYGQGEGRSKKDAEKRAAENALAKLKQEGLI